MLKTPNFFYKKTIISFALYPISLIFGFIVIIVYYFSKQKKVLNKSKVICVGNFTAGGTGKTPTCIAIAKQLDNVCFLTCGYGRQNSDDFFIKKGNPENFNAKMVGDEPLLLSRIADVFVVKKRYILPKNIDNYSYVICDDDLWDKSLKYDIKIAVLSQKYGFGNGFVLPAGPMRTFKRVANIMSDWLVVIKDGDGNHTADDYINYFALKKRLIYGTVKQDFVFDKTKKYLAFAGLGNNDKFFDMLQKDGYNVVEKKYFPDHYFYKKQDIELLEQMATKNNLCLITTEKDYVKIKEVEFASFYATLGTKVTLIEAVDRINFIDLKVAKINIDLDQDIKNIL